MLDERSAQTEAATSPAATRPPRILLADDDAISRKLLGAALERSAFTVEMAADGEEAVRRISATPPDVLVLDFEMPGLNGAEVCQHLRTSEREELRSLPVIMLTAHAGEAEEIECLEAGANDFVTKPVGREVLVARIQTQLRIQLLADELRRQNDELARWRVAQEADLAAAQATQRALIPTAPPVVPGWTVQTLYQPVIQVGGDAFGWRSAGDGRWIFWLADATGHGAAAALFTAMTAQLFHQASETESEASGIIREVNDAFRSVFSGRHFLTACCAVIDSQGGLSFCSAGHPPLLVRRANGSVKSFGPHATMIGLQEESTPDQSYIELQSGDAALLYTDGLFAFKDAKNERFTPQAVRTVLPGIETGADFIERVLAALQGRSDGESCDDDVAALALLRD